MGQFVLVLAVLFTAILNVGCDPSHTVPLIEDAADDGKKIPEILDFASVSKAVLIPYCVKCHSVKGGDQGGVNLETYQAVQPILRFIQDEVVSGRMPTARPLDADLQNVIVNWIKAGAPETSGAPAESPTIADSFKVNAESL